MSHTIDDPQVHGGQRRHDELTAHEPHAAAGGVHTTSNARSGEIDARSLGRLPVVVYVPALGTFLMRTNEFLTAGLLPELAGDLGVSVAHAPVDHGLRRRDDRRGAAEVDADTAAADATDVYLRAGRLFHRPHPCCGAPSFAVVLLAARFVAALATGAFWAVANVVAARSAGPGLSARALGVVGAGAILANVVGVPLGAVAGELAGWRAPFWALAAPALATTALVARHVPHDGRDGLACPCGPS